MADTCKILQEEIFRRAQKEMSLAAISEISGIPYSTIRNYAGHNGETACMPITALNKLVPVIGPELLSLFMPDGFQIVAKPEGVDHFEFADGLRAYLELLAKAQHPQSEAGTDLSENEVANLDAVRAQIGGAA